MNEVLKDLGRFKWIETLRRYEKLSFDAGTKIALFKGSRARKLNECNRCHRSIHIHMFMWKGIESSLARSIRICGECMLTLKSLAYNEYAEEINKYKQEEYHVSAGKAEHDMLEAKMNRAIAILDGNKEEFNG